MKFCVRPGRLLRRSTLTLLIVLNLYAALPVVARPLDAPATSTIAPAAEPTDTSASEPESTETGVPLPLEEFAESARAKSTTPTDKRILDVLEKHEKGVSNVLDHFSAMINGPRIKKELDQLVTNSKLKEVMHEHAIEFMATDHKHKQEKQKAELEIMRAKGEHGKELLEERLRSREREIESRAEAYEMQFKVLDTEERLRQAVELERMNSRAKSEFNLFLQNMMSDPDFCKSPVNSKWCNLFNEVLEIYKVNPDDIPARRNLLKESGENSHIPNPTGPQRKIQSGRHSCNPTDPKGRAPQRDDDDDGIDGPSGSASRLLPSPSTSQPGPSGSNSKDSSSAENGASTSPSRAKSASTANRERYQVDENIFNFLLEDAIAWNPKQIAAPLSSGPGKLSLSARPSHDVPPSLITYHPLDAPTVGGLPLAVEA